MATALSALGFPLTKKVDIAAKTPFDYPSAGLLVHQFDQFVEGYGGAVVRIYRAGTTTLMPVYEDIGLTILASNPQILISRLDPDGRTYGKFDKPLYVPYAYELQIDDEEQSGITRVPLYSMAGEDASNSMVTVSNSATARSLRERFGDTISLLDYGQITDSRISNTQVLNNAISAAASRGGGIVELPAGTIEFVNLVIPNNVFLFGKGKDVTTLLSEASRNVIESSGRTCGIIGLTLDGVQLSTRSVGFYTKAQEDIVLNDVKIKRFNTNMLHLGGLNHRYDNVDIEDAIYGARLLGDSNFTAGEDGSEFSGLYWNGGTVSLCSQTGLELSMRDLPVRHNSLHNLNILDNGGIDGGLYIYGARFTNIENPYFEGNVYNITVRDNPDQQLLDRKVTGLTFYAGQIQGGTNRFDGQCQEVIFDHMELNDTTFSGNVPENQILIRNCVENGTAFTGDSTKFSRWRTSNKGSVKGVTSDASAVVAYKRKLAQNEVVLAELNVTAERQNNATGKGAWKVVRAATCGPLLVPYKENTVSFTVGSEVQGVTSAAKGIIVADSGSVLSLTAVSGEFADNELIEETDGNGTAKVNGNVTFGTASLLGASTVIVYSAGDNTNSVPGGWGVGFQVSGQELQVTVQGAASADVVWNVDVNVTGL